jgi:uncharacterized protein (DUF169 family)
MEFEWGRRPVKSVGPEARTDEKCAKIKNEVIATGRREDMDLALKRDFAARWQKYFPGAEEPLAFFFSDEPRYAEFLKPKPERHELFCLIGQLGHVRRGDTLAFSRDTIGCSGGLRYTGFSNTVRPEFKYFLSCGSPGQVEGERYKKTPEIVEKMIAEAPVPEAEGQYLVFRPWNKVAEDETPEAVAFFVRPDALSGLFTLANFRTTSEPGVICPFGSACASVIGYPILEARNPRPRAILGTFDPSARPHVEADVLTFSAPWKVFLEMHEDMDESFLITNTWEQIRRRMAGRR